MANARQVKKKMRETAAQRQRKLAGLLQEYLFQDTPKDTHWAASNWIFNKDRPHTHVSGSKLNVSYAEAKTSAGILKRWNPYRGPVVLSNNVPYIGLLNAGHSPQAPPGFVQDAIRRSTQDARRR